MFVASIALVLCAAPALGVHVLKPYQVQRLTAFLNPSHDPRNQTCYNITQSLIAIGSGQKTGRGVADATQTSLHFLPENQTDFIFAVVGETYGFVGAALVLSLYALLIWRSLRILTMAKNLYGTLIAGGILAMLMFQVFVNVGMTIGIMPVTGVPLPLMSYGGSSVLVTFIAIGLLQSIHIQARMASAGKRQGADFHECRAPAPRHEQPARPERSPATAGRNQYAAPPAGRRGPILKRTESTIEEASAGQRRPWGDPGRAARGDRNGRRPQAAPASRGRRKPTKPGAGYQRRRALPRAPRRPLDRRQHLQGARRQRARRARGGVRRHRAREERLPARR